MIHSVHPRHRRAEIGAWVAPRARRRGVGSAALTLALDWAFGDLGLERVEIMALPENEIVADIAGRFGFTREGVLRKRNSSGAVASTSSSGGCSRASAEAAGAWRGQISSRARGGLRRPLCV